MCSGGGGDAFLVCWGVVACCGWVGVVEGYCCFVVVECFLEGRCELEFVVELVDLLMVTRAAKRLRASSGGS